MMRYLVIAGLLLAAAPALAADGFTQQDRDLLIELSVRVDELEKRMDERFEQVDNRMDERFEQVDIRFEEVHHRFDDMFNFFYLLTGIFTAIMVASIGFAFWDRRTVIRQARKEAVEFIEREGVTRRILQALQAAAQKDEGLAKAMRDVNLL